MARKKKEDGEASANAEAKTEEKVKRPKSIGPYDIVKMMFTDRDAFGKLSDITLERNYFMINRIFSIEYPLQAQFFNNVNSNLASVVKSWCVFAAMKFPFGRVPSFVYTRGAKASAELKADEFTIDKDIKVAYCMHYGISLRDFDDMMMFFTPTTYANVKQFERIFTGSHDKDIQKVK